MMDHISVMSQRSIAVCLISGLPENIYTNGIRIGLYEGSQTDDEIIAEVASEMEVEVPDDDTLEGVLIEEHGDRVEVWVERGYYV